MDPYSTIFRPHVGGVRVSGSYSAENKGGGVWAEPPPRIKVIIQIITIYYLKLQTVGVKISGSHVENHRDRYSK